MASKEIKTEKNHYCPQNVMVYLYMNAESGNCHVGELLLVEIIAKGNRSLFYVSNLSDHHFMMCSQWIHK